MAQQHHMAQGTGEQGVRAVRAWRALLPQPVLVAPLLLPHSKKASRENLGC